MAALRTSIVISFALPLEVWPRMGSARGRQRRGEERSRKEQEEWRSIGMMEARCGLATNRPSVVNKLSGVRSGRRRSRLRPVERGGRLSHQQCRGSRACATCGVCAAHEMPEARPQRSVARRLSSTTMFLVCSTADRAAARSSIEALVRPACARARACARACACCGIVCLLWARQHTRGTRRGPATVNRRAFARDGDEGWSVHLP